MGRRKKSTGAVGQEMPRPAVRPRPSTAQLVALVAIALVIGLSGGYLVFRLGGAAGTPAREDADPARAWRERLSRDPQDVEALLALAHIHLDRQEPDAAEPLYRRVLARDARNVEAITHLGAVALARGQGEAALRQYEAALAIQPDYVHALWDKANFQQQVAKDYAGAIQTWERFQRAVGSESADAKTAQGFIGEARQAMAALSPVEKAFDGTR
jgi:tetratricopeptide (TPR) repeat protein